MDILSSDRNLVHRPTLLALVAYDLGDFGRIDLTDRNIGRAARDGALVLGRAASDEVHGRLYPLGEISCAPMPMHMHIEHAWTLEEKMVVKRRHLEAVVEKRRHDRI